MQFKNILSMALPAIMVTVGMAVPLPAVPTTKVEYVKQNDTVTDKTLSLPEEQYKKGMKNFEDYWKQQSKPPSKEKPEGCLKWHMVRGAFGICRLWEEGAPHYPDGAPTVPRGTKPEDYPPVKRDITDKNALLGKIRAIQKVDDSLRNIPDPPEGCIEWIKLGNLMGYCREWEDIPADTDGEPPKIGKHNSQFLYTIERPVSCVDWVKKGPDLGYCRRWEDVKIPKEDLPEPPVVKHDHTVQTSYERPIECVDWTQVSPSTGYCLVWAEEAKKAQMAREARQAREELKNVEKRDVAKAKTREKSPFDIAMPYWTIAGL